MKHRATISPVSLFLFGGALAAGCSAKPAAQTAADPAHTPTVVRLEPAAPAAPAAAANGSSTRTTDRRRTLDDAFFDFDHYELTSAGRNALEADATWLRAHPGARIRVEGYADERGTSAYNLALGERRAEAVREYLSTLGVEKSRIETVSYGKERSFAPGHDEQAWAQNRRGHFALTAN